MIELRCDDPAHLDRCPDRACFVCGTAVFVDPADHLAPPRRPRVHDRAGTEPPESPRRRLDANIA